MEKTVDPKAKLVEHYLSEGRKALEIGNLDEARKQFEGARSVEGDHPMRDQEIQQMLMHTGNQAVAKEPPNWHLVNQSLDMLSELIPNSVEIWPHQRDLQLKEAEFCFEQANTLDQGFDIFRKLFAQVDDLDRRGELYERVAQIVCEYATLQAERQEWPLAHSVFDRAKDLWPTRDNTQIWLQAILKLSAAAKLASTSQDGPLAQLKTRVNEDDKKIKHLTGQLSSATQERDHFRQQVDSASIIQDRLQIEADESQRQIRSLNIVIRGLLILAVLAYPLAYFLYRFTG